MKKPPAMQKVQETQVQSLGWEDPLGEGMATTPVFLPGESHGQRSLEGYSPWGCKELDKTKTSDYEYSFMHTKKQIFNVGETAFYWKKTYLGLS